MAVAISKMWYSTLAVPRKGERGEEDSVRIWLDGDDGWLVESGDGEDGSAMGGAAVGVASNEGEVQLGVA